MKKFFLGILSLVLSIFCFVGIFAFIAVLVFVGGMFLKWIGPPVLILVPFFLISWATYIIITIAVDIYKHLNS